MHPLGYSRKDGSAVTLALGEAAANAISHGNRRDPTRSVLISLSRVLTRFCSKSLTKVGALILFGA
jgi:anti-sigma regulatory factor (Ser/Thr protein kinase)